MDIGNTASDKPGRESTGSPSDSANATRQGLFQGVTITYPARLIYYLNEESESTNHDLDTRARNQVSQDQVSLKSVGV